MQKTLLGRDKLRKSGIDLLGDVPWGTHFCQFYSKKQDLADILVPYFKAGLEQNEFCMWVTAEPLDVKEAEQELKRAVPGLSQYMERGQIEIIPHTEWYLKGGVFDSGRVLSGWVDKLSRALERGFDGLRLTGNTFWLEKEGWRDFVAYEEEVDKVIGGYRMMAICTYSLEKCRSAEVIDVVANHQFALTKRDGRWEIIENSERRRIDEALRKNQEDLNRAQAVSRTGSWRLDVRRNELLWSDETYRIFEVPKGTPLTYEAFLAAVHPDDREFVGKSWQAAQKGGPYDIEHRITVGDGVKWVRERAELEIDPQGNLLGGFGTVQDITERKALEQHKADFYAMVTHDIKSPLTAILGYSDFMLTAKQDKLDAEIKEMVEQIQGSGGKLLRMVEDFLSISRMEAGRFIVKAAPEDVFLCLWEARREVEAAAMQKGLNLKAEVPDGLPRVVMDRKLVLRAVTNLLHNAVNFTPQGADIALRAEKDGGFVVVSVSDSGPGIPKEEQASIFDKYYRLPRTSGIQGSGLGLAIVKAVAEAHGGRVELESVEGKGSTFRLILPIGPAQ